MKLSAKLPQDDQGAKLTRFDDVRGRAYKRWTLALCPLGLGTTVRGRSNQDGKDHGSVLTA